MHPILGALDGTPHEWVKKLLFTFNEGNIGKFEALAPLFPKEVGAPVFWNAQAGQVLTVIPLCALSTGVCVCVCIIGVGSVRSTDTRNVRVTGTM